MSQTSVQPPVVPATAVTGTRPPRTRSPLYLFTLITGVIVAVLGWGVATVFDRSLIATSADLGEVVDRLPGRVRSVPGSLVTIGTLAAVTSVHLWLLAARQLRRLALAYAAFALGFALATLTGDLLMGVLRPEAEALYDVPASDLTRSRPFDPYVGGVVALLVLVRKWIPERGRRAAYVLLPLWLVCDLAAPGPPYLAVVLDVGVGMVAGSVVPLALRTPTQRPGRSTLIASLAGCGLDLVDLRPADLDARGSEPWFGSTATGQRVFIKVLTSDQRVADLMFRAGRWLRLRRTGDAPPEISLKRAAEHEAFLSHHVRSVGTPSPKVLAVADMGDDTVALVYEAVAGRSLDHVARDEVTDEVLAATWRHVARLRAHGIAHRDLRLANVFLAEDAGPLLIDFSFGELSASPQLLDTDVAELLAATSTVVGATRAVRAAVSVLGPEAVAAAREWLLPVALTTATRKALAGGDASLEELRAAAEAVPTPEVPTPAARPVGMRGLALAGAITLAGYGAAATALGDGLGERVAGVRWPLLIAAIAVGLLVHPARGMAFRSASVGRAPFRLATTASLAAHVPAAAPTAWVWTGRVLFAAARGAGLSRASAAEAVSTWISAGIFITPVLVAGVAANGWRVVHGYALGIALGAACGLGLLVFELAALRAAPVRWDITGVWGAPHDTAQRSLARSAGAVGWWAVARLAQATALVIVAQAVGVEASTEALVAVSLGAGAIVALSPVPGGVGVAEATLFLGLVVVGVDPGGAAFAAVLTRLATFWAHVPLAAWVRSRTAATAARPAAAPAGRRGT